MTGIDLRTFHRGVDLALGDLRGDARKAAFIGAAAEIRDEVTEENRAILGHAPSRVQIVDGRVDAPLSSVREGGVVAYRFILINEVVDFILTELARISPVLTGAYRDAHRLLVNGREVEPPYELQENDEALIVNLQPYARRIEVGSSSQAPNGVYDLVAVMADKRFGNAVKIVFEYAPIIGYGPKGPRSRRGGTATRASDDRFPAIRVSV